jgi:hypothetical protein
MESKVIIWLFGRSESKKKVKGKKMMYFVNDIIILA